MVGAIPRAFEQAFGLGRAGEKEAEADVEEDSLCDGFAAVALSKKDKERIRAPWTSSLIVKSFGRSLGYMFLLSKIRELWRPSGRTDCIDLGHDFFLIKFECKEDIDKVLKGGPWFIGQQFLTIRLWEPEFKASEASFSSVAVWIRLLELPIEYYDLVMLRKIGEAIGPVLRIDAHTANGARGRFARLCVQVNLDKPLIKTVKIGRLAQIVLYEGLNTLCFKCGRIGHRKETCPHVIKGPQAEILKQRKISPIVWRNRMCGRMRLKLRFIAMSLMGMDSGWWSRGRRKLRNPGWPGMGKGLLPREGCWRPETEGTASVKLVCILTA